MDDSGLRLLATRIEGAAVAYRAALGSDITVTGKAYDDLVRIRRSDVIELGRQYETLADTLGIPDVQRLRWTGYILPTSRPVHDDALDPAPTRTVVAASPDLAAPDDGVPAHDVSTILGAAISMLGASERFDAEAWATMFPSAQVSAVPFRDPGLAVQTELPAVSQIMASSTYRDALQSNLRQAIAWIDAQASSKAPAPERAESSPGDLSQS